ncbi:MAG TPA: hypothetical protein VLS28_10405 [Candidatus Sulfomarinibacteraceae bacterium]|nr:hypothetical protein [Candidatus Sulfomarinibacteraceae bacterium]
MGTRGASRELVVAAAAVILVSRLVDGPIAWLVGALLLIGVALGTLQVLGESGSPSAAAGVPVESLLATSVAAFAVFGSIRLVPLGLVLAPALLGGAWLIGRVLATEMRILTAPTGPSGADRTAILVEVLVVAFLGFAGIAALVPGGLPEPGVVLTEPPSGGDLAVLAVADGFLAFLLAYRSAALRSSNLRDVAWFALTSGVVVGIAAVALRAMEIPRLLGPALLILVLFLWDAVHGTTPTTRRDPRRIWETVLLVVLGIVVAAWSVRLRG